MEDLAAVNVTNALTTQAMEQSADDKHPLDPSEPEFEEAAGISPREETPITSPADGVRFHIPNPTEAEEVDVLEPAASRAELHSPSSLEDEQVPILEAEQAAVEPNILSHAEEDEVLPSEASFSCVEHDGPVLLEGEEASVPEPATPPPQECREASSGLAQGGAEPNYGAVEVGIDPDTVHEAGSDEVAGYEVAMAEDQVEAAWDEFTEEAVESTGEDVEAAGSGDVISENEFSVAIDVRRRGGRRRKRGRASSKVQGARFPSRKKVEEEVCFICFDGGDLVVCDRRGCPKVYHPSCVNREESYFQSKGQWSCGWHICSKCQKSASYMCYTCTYSLCKVCVNEAEFTCIRGKKGFCPSCMGTVLLMETSENADKKKDGVDFNDRTCWEYLFKDYWLELKGRLSMNLDEITKAGIASKAFSLDIANEDSSDDGLGAGSDRFTACHDEIISSKKKSNLARSTTSEISGKQVEIEGVPPPEGTSRKRRKRQHSRKEGETEFSTVRQENPSTIRAKKRSRKTVSEEGAANDTESEGSVCKKSSSRKKSRRKSRSAAEENLAGDAAKELTTAPEDDHWASKELLAFVTHVKNGDTSILSQYDVQELLLDYIKANNLRDPRRRSQIICDRLLLALFGKSRVGHFEMLKLVESHFFIRASSAASDENRGDDADPIETGNEVNDGLIANKGLMTRKRVEMKLHANFYDYAAIDSYNISLMYLRRSFMEELIDDMISFSEKVLGSFVRIRVSASGQRLEVYRLVQVVGCGKAPEEYKTGKKKTDVMLEIINLDRKEVITIDIISNQDFTEEECKRLRQSIKFGFISRLTVGEVQEKARVLQAVRAGDHFESEKLRLTHLRDRASEKGRKKEHRECVEKLQLLSTPEEQMKRFNEVPDVHTDPKMDPSYESPEEDEDENKEGNPMQSTFKGRELTFPQKEDGYSWRGALKSSNNGIVMDRARHSDDFQQSMELHSTETARASEVPSRKEEDEKINVETQRIESKAPVVEPLSGHKEPSRELAVQPELKLETLPAKVDPLSNAGEAEKLWHYKDPSGKIQGPFSMVQLRKWSKHFPSNLGIWRRSERQEDSIFLTDALAGNFQRDLPEWVPGDIKPTQAVKTSDTTSLVNSAHSSSPSPPIISSSKKQGTAASLSVYIDQGKLSKSDDACVSTSHPSLLGSHLANQQDVPYKTSRHELVAANAVDSESIDLHDRPAAIPLEIDSSKKLLEQPGTAGNNVQLKTEVIGEVSALEGHDSDIPFNSNSCSNHCTLKLTDNPVDHSTSSTESNTVPELSSCDPCRPRFRNGGSSDVKPNALESVSPQRSDASTFPNPVPETLQPAYTNSFAQNSGASFATSVHTVNAYDQAPSQNVQPNLLVSQTFGPCNWNLPNDAKGREQATPTVLSSSSAGVSTTVNCQNAPQASSDGSKPFSSPQLSNSTSAVAFQPSNTGWVTGTPEVSNPAWQAPNQYQSFGNAAAAAAVGSLLCGSGVQAGFGATNNLGWGMMAQGNVNMPWGVPPNANIGWGQGLTFPPQGIAPPNFVWGTPQGNTVPSNGCRPMAQGNAAPYPFWNGPVPPGNPSQNPFLMPAPAVAGNMNMSQNSKASAWDSPKDKFRERSFGPRAGDFRGGGSGHGSGRQPRNWVPSGNAEGPARPLPENTRICKFFENGHCKKGGSCNYIHS